MTELKQLTEWIETRKPSIKRPNARVIRNLDSEIMAKKTVLSIAPVFINPVEITNTAGNVGKLILLGIEDLSVPEAKINRRRIDVGLEIIQLLISKNLLKIQSRKDNTRDAYMLKIDSKNNAFIDQLFYSIPVDQLPIYINPVLNKPQERKEFACPIGGHLVHLHLFRNLSRFDYNNCPIVYDVVNKHQGTPWRINQQLLEVYNCIQDDNIFSYRNLKLRRDARLSKRREDSLILSKSNELGDNIFYHHYYYDFRFRFYCSTHYLNPQGSKLAKSLHYFVNAKKLGAEGLFWLKVHLANTLGFDKLQISDRAKMVDDNLGLILSVGSDLVANKWFWTSLDTPQEAAAALLELSNAYALEDPKEFISGLPVAFDATCSGLQIFAMLARDEKTGALCNLIPGLPVGDNYLHIADDVWKKLLKSDSEFAGYWLRLKGKRRKIVKRSAMTYLYSCGASTMGKHIYDDFKVVPAFDGISRKHTEFLGQLIYDSCVELMPGAAQLMELFQDIGKKLAIDGKDLSLTGPYNDAPFTQIYRTSPIKGEVFFGEGKRRRRLKYIKQTSETVRKSKVKTASSPNIVHMLDAQIVSCLSIKVDYDTMVIHDSFSSCAADAGKLFEDIRDVYVEVFGPDVLQQLCDEAGVENTIEYGNLLIDKIVDNDICVS